MSLAFYSFDDIRRVADCREIAAELYGCVVKNGRCAALWRGGKDPSNVSIDREKWYDHGGEGKNGGGAIELANFKFGDAQTSARYLGEKYHLTPKYVAGPAPGHESRYDTLIREGYLQVARYEYRDLSGAVRHVTIRLQHPEKPGKEFVQGHEKDGRWIWSLKGVETVLYRLPEIRDSEWVLICEGEKSADRLAALGLPTTTAPMGAGKWKDAYSESMRGKKVVIAPDNDEPGREHAELVARSLYGIAAAVRIVGPLSSRPKGGVDDWMFDENHTADELCAAIQAAPEWRPAHEILSAAESSASTPCEQSHGPTDAQLAAAKAANSIPFRNYIPVEKEVEGRGGRKSKEVTKEPRTHASMLDDIARRFLAFPRKVGSEWLFDHDRDSGEIIEISDSERLLAWIARRSKHNPEWTRGDAMCTPRQLYASIIATCLRYEAISRTPDWPRRPDVYYAHGAIPPPCPRLSRLNSFVDHFLPASECDRRLIMAFACTPLWYVPGIPRPSWIIDSPDGQGAGKSNLVDLVAELYGGNPIRSSKQELSSNLQVLVKRLVSATGREARILLIDNVIGDFQSPELSDLITARSISGMAPYGRGEENRPNNLVYCITANSATVSTDLADRSIYIHVRKPSDDQKAGWKVRVQSYISAHRMEIISDIISLLSAHKPFSTPLRTRFPEFEQTILQPCCGSPEAMADVIEHLAGARADSNIEEDQARMIAEAFDFNVAKALNSDIPRPVFLRSEVVNSWGRRAISDSYEYKGKPIQLVRNLSKIGMLKQADRAITRWPLTSARNRFSGVAWRFTESTETCTVIGLDADGNVTREVM